MKKLIMILLLSHLISICSATEKKFYIDAFTEENIPLINLMFDDLQKQNDTLSAQTTGYVLKGENKKGLTARDVSSEPRNNLNLDNVQENLYELETEYLSRIGTNRRTSRTNTGNTYWSNNGMILMSSNTDITEPQYTLDLNYGNLRIKPSIDYEIKYTNTGILTNSATNGSGTAYMSPFAVYGGNVNLTLSGQGGNLTMTSADPSSNPCYISMEGYRITSQGSALNTNFKISAGLQMDGGSGLIGGDNQAGWTPWTEINGTTMGTTDLVLRNVSNYFRSPRITLTGTASDGVTRYLQIMPKIDYDSFTKYYFLLSSTDTILSNQYGKINIGNTGFGISTHTTITGNLSISGNIISTTTIAGNLTVQGKITGDGSGLTGIIDSDVRNSTGTIQNQVNSIALSTGILRNDLTSVSNSTGAIQTQLTDVAVSTGALRNEVNVSTGAILFELRSSTGGSTDAGSWSHYVATATVNMNNQSFTNTAGTNISFGGENLLTTGNLSVGSGALSSGSNSLSVGENAATSTQNSIAAGDNCSTGGISSIAGGHYSTTSQAYGIALGNTAIASGNSSVAFGNNCTASGGSSFTTGFYSTASGSNAFALGHTITASGTNSFGIGSFLNIGGSYNMILGAGITAGSELTNNTAYSLMVGFNRTTPEFSVFQSSVVVADTFFSPDIVSSGTITIGQMLKLTNLAADPSDVNLTTGTVWMSGYNLYVSTGWSGITPLKAKFNLVSP